MTATPNRRTLLDELETRHDEVLDGLDDLNLRIEAVLREALAGRADTDAVSAVGS